MIGALRRRRIPGARLPGPWQRMSAPPWPGRTLPAAMVSSSLDPRLEETPQKRQHSRREDRLLRWSVLVSILPILLQTFQLQLLPTVVPRPPWKGVRYRRWKTRRGARPGQHRCSGRQIQRPARGTACTVRASWSILKEAVNCNTSYRRNNDNTNLIDRGTRHVTCQMQISDLLHRSVMLSRISPFDSFDLV